MMAKKMPKKVKQSSSTPTLRREGAGQDPGGTAASRRGDASPRLLPGHSRDLGGHGGPSTLYLHLLLRGNYRIPETETPNQTSTTISPAPRSSVPRPSEHPSKAMSSVSTERPESHFKRLHLQPPETGRLPQVPQRRGERLGLCSPSSRHG